MAKRKAKSKESNVVITKRPAEKLQTLTRKNVRCPRCKTSSVHNKGRLGSTVYYRCNSCFNGVNGTSTTFQVFFDRDLSTAFGPGEWADKKVVIVGPHPYAMNFDGRGFKSCPTIAIGAAWLLFSKFSLIPDIFFASFKKFIEKARDDDEFNTWTNYKACPDSISNEAPNSWLTVKTSKDPFSDQLRDGVMTSHDCIAAVCIAASLGAREFDLVGFQLDGNDMNMGFSPEAEALDKKARSDLDVFESLLGLKLNFIG